MGLHGYLASLINNDGDGLHGSGLHQDIQTDGTVSQDRLLAGVTLLAGFDRRLTNCISLLELIQLLGQAPEAAEVVVKQFAVGIDAYGKAPIIQLYTDALGDTIKQPDIALGRLGKLQALAGSLNGLDVANLGLDGHRVTHWFAPK